MQINRVIGSFCGAMAGDCAGTPYIFMKSKNLEDKMRETGWNLSSPGIDMELAMASLRAISRYGVNTEKIFKQYRRWVNGCVSDLDIVSSQCFHKKVYHSEMAKANAQRLDFGSLCSNALLIRQMPIVYAGLTWDSGTLRLAIADDCILSHIDEQVIECAQLYALVLQWIILGRSRLEIWDMLFEYVVDPELHQIIISSYYDIPRADENNYNDIKVAFQMALYHFWHDTPYVSGVRSAIHSGGSTDINAAAVGALLGAFHGRDTIPETWYNALLCSDDGCETWRSRFHKSLGQLQKMIEKSAILLPLNQLHPVHSGRWNRKNNRFQQPRVIAQK